MKIQHYINPVKKPSAIQIVFQSLRRLSLRNLWKLVKKALAHPVFAVLTFWATLKTYTIAERYYPRTHDANGEGNAFRHAFWNCLIMMYCCKVSSPQKALKWTEEITDLHEELFPNDALSKKMDLHNNQVGRDYFMSLLPTIHRQFFETHFFIDQLMEMTNNIVLLESEDQELGFRLVKIE